MRLYSLLVCILTLLLLVSCSSPLFADDETLPKYEPSKTRVVILPLVNKADDLQKSFKDKIQTPSYKSMVKRFTERGFEVVPKEEVESALTEMKMDLNDRENWLAPSLLQIGTKLKSQLVLLCVVGDAHNNTNFTTFSIYGGSKEGIANVRAFLIDTDTKRLLLKGAVAEGKNTGGAFGDFDRGMPREARAVALGLDRSLKPFLMMYPNHPASR